MEQNRPRPAALVFAGEMRLGLTKNRAAGGREPVNGRSSRTYRSPIWNLPGTPAG